MLTIEPNRTALLLMDLQADIVGMIGEKGPSVLDNAAALLAAARSAKIQVLYVVVGFRPGYPEVSPRNASFDMLSKSGRFTGTTPGADVAPEVRPAEGDIVVVKHRVSAFGSTDLDMILRAKGIDTLVLSGVSTSGVVLSTVRHAADADYRIVVAKDACADRDDEVHRVLTEKVFDRQTTVATTSDIVKAVAVSRA